jgi:hypothetical protein
MISVLRWFDADLVLVLEFEIEADALTVVIGCFYFPEKLSQI